MAWKGEELTPQTLPQGICLIVLCTLGNAHVRPSVKVTASFHQNEQRRKLPPHKSIVRMH